MIYTKHEKKGKTASQRIKTIIQLEKHVETRQNHYQSGRTQQLSLIVASAQVILKV